MVQHLRNVEPRLLSRMGNLRVQLTRGDTMVYRYRVENIVKDEYISADKKIAELMRLFTEFEADLTASLRKEYADAKAELEPTFIENRLAEIRAIWDKIRS